MNYTYYSCVLTYLSLPVIISNSTGMAHLKTEVSCITNGNYLKVIKLKKLGGSLLLYRIPALQENSTPMGAQPC